MDEGITGFLRGVIALAAMGLFMAGALIAGFSFWTYLQSGVWETPSLAALMTAFFPETAASLSLEWIGLWNILESTSAWFGSFIAGIVLFLVALIGD